MNAESSRLAIALVHYRTPGLLRPAIEALLADLAASPLAAEIVVVDNDPVAEAGARLADLPVRVLTPGENLGYAGGVALAVAATASPLLVAMNPDVLVRRGCLAALVAELERGAAIVGPRLFWDEERRFRLPPNEPRRPSWELAVALARRYPALRRSVRARWRRHARRFWLARAPLASADLSGALLAFRRDDYASVGGFDPGFRLYFEESDLIARLVRSGRHARFVPAAEAVHLYAQSSRREPATERWFAESAARFRDRHYGAWTARRLAALERRAPVERGGSPAALRPDDAWTPRVDGAGAAWLEVGAQPLGLPAAGELRSAEEVGRPWSLPAAVGARLAPGRYSLRAVATSGREGEVREWVQGEGS
jgi:N-acetylglucosaminyl-diphospho-decaprenol L-rhamnosyltransferase